MKKISLALILSIVWGVVGIGFARFSAIAQSNIEVQTIDNKHQTDCPSVCSQSSKISPRLIALLSKTLSNLDKTTNTGQGFDYYPNGGIRIAYYHLATFISYQAIANLSPYPVFLSGPHGNVTLNLNSSQTFGHYNPQFLQWFQDHLSEILSDKRFIELTRDNFQTYLGSTLNTYWATYMTLNQYPEEFNTLLEDYQQRLQNRSLPEGYYYNIAWSENSANYDSLTQLNETYNPNVIAPAVYFWLRRRLDGTEDKVFSMLEYIITAYQSDRPGNLYYDTEQLPIPDL